MKIEGFTYTLHIKKDIYTGTDKIGNHILLKVKMNFVYDNVLNALEQEDRKVLS